MSVVEPSTNGKATMAGVSRGPGGGGDGAAEQENVQETLAKFKRLLSLARRSIEENQRQITEKDGQLAALREALGAAENARRRDDEHAGATPLQLLRRVREGGMWWLLVEYDDEYETQGWKGFADEAAVSEFANSVNVGEPLNIPPVSLSPEESATVLEDARKQVASIREEYRKFRVKSELGRKQREAEIRQVSAESIAEKQRRISGQGAAVDKEQVHALEDELQRVRDELTDKEESWRQAYQKQVKETEVLKREGGDTALAAQWRQRYEKLSLEKEDAVAKLDMFKGDGGSGSGGGRGGGGGGQGEAVASLMKKYQDLKEEYRLYRKKAMHAIQGAGAAGGGGGESLELQDPKLQYLKNLMLKYLGTDEGEAREHMERAIATVLQFSEQERQDLKEARQAQTVAWMSNFTGMFAGSAPAAGGAGGTQSSPASPAVAAGGRARRMSGGGAIA
ncbi:unnamed protein product [Ectocarpus sp. 12 AP-2014]